MNTLAQAVKQVRDDNDGNEYIEQGIQAFIALYGMLGDTELYDGMSSAMQDAGFDEVYEDIMHYYEA